MTISPRQRWIIIGEISSPSLELHVLSYRLLCYTFSRDTIRPWLGGSSVSIPQPSTYDYAVALTFPAWMVVITCILMRQGSSSGAGHIGSVLHVRILQHESTSLSDILKCLDQNQVDFFAGTSKIGSSKKSNSARANDGKWQWSGWNWSPVGVDAVPDFVGQDIHEPKPWRSHASVGLNKFGR